MVRQILFHWSPVRAFLALFLKNRFEIDFTSATDKIHFGGSDPASSLENLPEEIECNNDGECEIGLEEGVGIGFATNGEQSDVKLSNETEDVEDKTGP